MVILIVGKAGAGKTTWAKRLAQELKASGKKVSVLDGDAFRAMHCNQDFSNLGRYQNLSQMAQAAAIIEGGGRVCIVAAVAPRKEWRDMMRAMWKQSMLVYVPGGELWSGTEFETPEFSEWGLR